MREIEFGYIQETDIISQTAAMPLCLLAHYKLY